uniref:Peptidase S1 domain-containing protein n=1 Tax=Chrysemys picta bellii TaxID=8478 RepID=A0A8C3FZQ8_CHRPI
MVTRELQRRWDSLHQPGLPPGEIIRGQEAQPHSRPHMAYLDTLDADEKSRCGGFPVLENFVLTAAHCNGRKGDSGGPLVCEKTAQAVYTRVSTFIPWIQETMRRLQP